MAMISREENSIQVLMQSKQIVDVQVKFFDELWKNADKNA
jgi:hypothetical protein